MSPKPHFHEITKLCTVAMIVSQFNENLENVDDPILDGGESGEYLYQITKFDKL